MLAFAPFPRRIRRVNRSFERPCDPARTIRLLVDAVRDAATPFVDPCRDDGVCHDGCVCAGRARPARQYFRQSAAAATEQCRPAEPGSGRRRRAGYSAGTHPAGADAAAAGRSLATARTDPATRASARRDGRASGPAAAGDRCRTQSAAWRAAGPAPAADRAGPATTAAGRNRAARRRDRHRAAGAEGRQQASGVRRPRQDYRPHHQVRCGHGGDRAVRCAAGQTARLLHAPGH